MAAGTLPQVSWIHGPVTQCEHPATAPQWGENLVQSVLDTLTSNPEVWAHTLFILNYDENGGFFDHVPPPVPPAGTAGEYLTTVPLPADAGGCAGPVGLGFRVPCLLMSPFTTGGYVAHRGVRPHLDPPPDREALRGTGAERLGLAAQHGRRPDQRAGTRPTGATGPPTLPVASLAVPVVDEEVVVNALTGTFDEGFSYPPPTRTSCPSRSPRRHGGPPPA